MRELTVPACRLAEVGKNERCLPILIGQGCCLRPAWSARRIKYRVSWEASLPRRRFTGVAEGAFLDSRRPAVTAE